MDCQENTFSTVFKSMLNFFIVDEHEKETINKLVNKSMNIATKIQDCNKTLDLDSTFKIQNDVSSEVKTLQNDDSSDNFFDKLSDIVEEKSLKYAVNNNFNINE